jgi:beta-xylosidase
VRLFEHRWNEAPALFKQGGRYWLISSGCTGWNPNAARLAVADSIWGPWTDLGNPCAGSEQQKKNTFESQSTYVLPVAGKPGAFIFMADRWRPANAIDGRYIWLPIQFKNGQPVIEWQERWDLSVW